MYKKSSEALDIDQDINTKELVMNIFEGSLHLLKESQQTFENQKKEVITPNGTTHAGLLNLEKCSPHFDDTLQAAFERAKEFGKQINNS